MQNVRGLMDRGTVENVSMAERTKEQELLEFFNCLEDIAIDVGDNRDCLGNYVSDRIRNLVKEFRPRLTED